MGLGAGRGGAGHYYYLNNRLPVNYVSFSVGVGGGGLVIIIIRIIDYQLIMCLS